MGLTCVLLKPSLNPGFGGSVSVKTITYVPLFFFNSSTNVPLNLTMFNASSVPWLKQTGFEQARRFSVKGLRLMLDPLNLGIYNDLTGIMVLPFGGIIPKLP